MRSLPCEAPGAPSAAEDHAGRVLSVPRGRMSEGVSLRACGQCNRQAEHLMVCSGCRAAWYCGQDHQRLHWKKHKVFCKPKNGATQSSSQKNEARSKKVSPKTNFTLDSAVLDAMVSGRDVSDCTLPFQSNGDGVRGGRRRPRGGDPEMSAPLDPSEAPEAAPLLPRPRTPSLQHVEMFTDAQSLEEVGFNQNWFNRLAQFVISDLNMYGVCVIENFLGESRADQIRSEVGGLHRHGVFHDGEVMARQEQARGRVRGDKITWVTGSEPNCSSIGQLVSVVDSLVAKCNNHQDAGKLASYNIKWRTRAMVACYPGQGTHYVKHVDNPNGDGRCITAIYYINKDWRPEDGGVLRIYPEGMNQVANIEPLFDRMLFFWSDRRNPHEVMPASITRYAITVWYLDQNERENYLSRIQSTSSST
ncbi:prolyl hydroxylase EGLN3-like isoform X3 [Penaeus monodon]|uniref:prolyl hydroxylase EGLN3-like isoform X3 n=1 Tax=Penaeus monodon TaxID=6687 RepID=UPI0018A72883|nr:prolyl hydroxylase EGLN3-like isoform X3 [Penaeus monodon]